MSPLLTWMIFLPLAGTFLVLALPSGRRRLLHGAALVFTGLPLALAVLMLAHFDTANPGLQFQERARWIPGFGIDWFVGVDGLSITMVALTALLSFLCVFASFGIDRHLKAYYALFLLLETGMLGVFCALDFFLFYVFWEVVLLPMYFLIGHWGGPRRHYAAIKFFLYTLVGSVLMLLAILALYFANGRSFDMVRLLSTGSQLPRDLQLWAFAGFFVAFAVKVPIVPFHTWLPDAHVEAPTPISVLLAGVLLKMGVYGLFRVSHGMLPAAMQAFVPWLALLGVINIVYGALVAMAQKDMKRLVAYSSVSHMGFCLLGLAAMNTPGFTGAVLQMFNHGVISAMLFLIVGVLYDRAHHRNIDGFGGMFARLPRLAPLVVIAFFAALGLPGLSGFVGEALALLGAFQSLRPYALVGAAGIVLAAAYMLWLTQRVFLGAGRPGQEGFPDLSLREAVTLVPLALLVVLFGVYPTPLIRLMSGTLQILLPLARP